MANDRILSAVELYGVRDLAELDQLRRHLADERGASIPATAVPNVQLNAYVNHNRWVADCACGAGIALAAEEPTGVCISCFSRWRIDRPAPAERKRGEAALLRRPPWDRHWQAHRGETAAMLERENDVRLRPQAEEVLAMIQQDKRARINTTKAINPELFTKILGVPVSTSGDLAAGRKTTIVAEAPVTQERLEKALATYTHDDRYRLANDPNPPDDPRLAPNPSVGDALDEAPKPKPSRRKKVR